MSLRRIWPLPIISLLCGCVLLPDAEYPAQWPAKIDASQSCTPIAGVFSNSGQRSRTDYPYPAPSLTDFFIPNQNFDDVDSVEIQSHNKFLMVTIYAEGAEKERITVEGECSEFGIKVVDNANSGFENADGMLGQQWAFWQVAQAADGSLIAMQNQGGVGLAFLIPVFSTGTDEWFLYPAASK